MLRHFVLNRGELLLEIGVCGFLEIHPASSGGHREERKAGNNSRVELTHGVLLRTLERRARLKSFTISDAGESFWLHELFSDTMSRLRTLASRPTELVRITSMLAIWIGLHVYAARPLLTAAAAGGIAPTIAWTGALLLPFITALPMLSRRRIAQTIGYGVMSILTMLLVIVFCSDLVRIVLPSRLPALHGLPTLGIAAILALIGFL